jgi:hypothetical protein
MDEILQKQLEAHHVGLGDGCSLGWSDRSIVHVAAWSSCRGKRQGGRFVKKNFYEKKQKNESRSQNKGTPFGGLGNTDGKRGSLLWFCWLRKFVL